MTKTNHFDIAWDEKRVRRYASQAHRIVVKVGSSSLSSISGGLNQQRLGDLVDALAAQKKRGRDIVLVSSGAIATGLQPLGLVKRPKDLAHQQAAAAVGQGVLMQHYAQRFAEHGILTGQVLITVEDLTRRDSYTNTLRTLGTLLKMGVVPIINENDTVATHEIRFGDNDRIAALVAQLTRADMLFLFSDVSALYTAHPDLADSSPISFVDDVESLQVDTSRIGSNIGSGGMKTKLVAAQIANSAGIPVVLGNTKDANYALNGQQVGTAFAPIDKPRPRRLLWLAYASNSRGTLYLDEGAVAAVKDNGASLLAAGIKHVEGDFVSGDPVEIVSSNGEAIARGLVSFDSRDLPKMLGKNTGVLRDELGAEFVKAVVHRDAMILLHEGSESVGDF